MKALHFGAGNIGRGFIGALLSQNDFDVCFVDVNDALIQTLNKQHAYNVELTDAEHTVFSVDHVTALNSLTAQDQVIEAIVGADLITTSVGVNNLDKIASLLGKGLLKRANGHAVSVDLLANENAINATDLLKEALQNAVSEADFEKISAHVGFVNTSIDRQSLSKEINGETIPLVEPYYEWLIEKKTVKNEVTLGIDGATYVDDLTPYIERKLYIVNAGHAASAYLGHFLGFESVQTALADPSVSQFVKNLMTENAQYFVHFYHMDPTYLATYIEKTLSRHSNPNLHDDVNRVARSPIRKLGANERLVAPVKKLRHLNLPSSYGARAIALALCYQNPSDAEAQTLQADIEALGTIDALKKYSHLKDTELLMRIDQISKTLKTDKTSIFKES